MTWTLSAAGSVFWVRKSSRSRVLMSCLVSFCQLLFPCFADSSHTKLLENFFFFFWHGLHGNLLIETVMDAVRGGYFLLRALARGLISSHSAIVSGCVRLDNLFHCFELPFHHLYKHLQSIVSSASREHCVKWNLWSQLLLTLGPTGFHKQENTK